MRIPKKKAKVVLDVIHSLEVHKKISAETAEAVCMNIEPIPFDWRRLARYSFVAALSCFVIAVVAMFCDEVVLNFLSKALDFFRRFLKMPPIVRSVGGMIASSSVIWLGLRAKKKTPEKIYQRAERKRSLLRLR